MPRIAVVLAYEEAKQAYLNVWEQLAEVLRVTTGASVHRLKMQESFSARLIEHRAVRWGGRKLGVTNREIWPAVPGGLDFLIFVGHDFGHLYHLRGTEAISSARTAALIHGELWPGEVSSNLPTVRQVHSKVDLVFTCHSEAVEELSPFVKNAAHYLPWAIDTSLFIGKPKDRCITISNYGRRCPEQHRTLIDWTNQQDLFYWFSTTDGPVHSLTEHSQMLGSMLSRSVAVVTNYARFDQPHRTRGSILGGIRFLEALAGGCVLLGDLPDMEPLVGSISTDGIVSFPLGATRLPEEFISLTTDRRRLADIAREHSSVAIARHDVYQQVAQILSVLGVPVPEEMRLRQKSLLSQVAR